MVIREAQEKIERYLKDNEAWWVWNRHKHLALLASAKVSNAYINCTPLFYSRSLKHLIGQALSNLIIHDMEDRLGTVGMFEAKAEIAGGNAWVIGSAMGGIWIAEVLADSMGCRPAFAEKDYVEVPFPTGTKIVNRGMALKRFDLGRGARVILVEDVLTTGGTTSKTFAAVREKHRDAVFYPTIFCIVNRSGLRSIAPPAESGVSTPEHLFAIQSIIDVQADSWPSMEHVPAEMQDCKPLQPKGNWWKLVSEKLE